MRGAKIFKKSHVNQPNQGHQPWQSSSLGEDKIIRIRKKKVFPPHPKIHGKTTSPELRWLLPLSRTLNNMTSGSQQ